VFRNRVSEEMYRLARQALAAGGPGADGEPLRVAYFSGTRTHAKDFAECVPALRTVLTRFPHVRLMIVGELDVPAELAEFAPRIDTLPLVPWRELPALYRKAAIN